MTFNYETNHFSEKLVILILLIIIKRLVKPKLINGKIKDIKNIFNFNRKLKFCWTNLPIMRKLRWGHTISMFYFICVCYTVNNILDILSKSYYFIECGFKSTHFKTFLLLIFFWNEIYRIE